MSPLIEYTHFPPTVFLPSGYLVRVKVWLSSRDFISLSIAFFHFPDSVDVMASLKVRGTPQTASGNATSDQHFVIVALLMLTWGIVCSPIIYYFNQSLNQSYVLVVLQRKDECTKVWSSFLQKEAMFTFKHNRIHQVYMLCNDFDITFLGFIENKIFPWQQPGSLLMMINIMRTSGTSK